MNRSSFMQSVSDNICHTMLAYSHMDYPQYPYVQADADNEIRWPGLSTNNDTFDTKCSIKDFNPNTMDDDSEWQCPEVVKSPGYMAVLFAAHGDENEGTYSNLDKDDYNA